MTLGVLNEALRGIQQNQRRFEHAAGDIVRATTVGQESAADAPDLTDSSVRLLTARRGLEASLAVARAGDEMLGTIIDMLA